MTREKNNNILSISLLALVVLILVLYELRNNSKLGVSDKNMFRIDELSSVDQITIHTEEKHIVLHYDGNRWKVNDQHDAATRLVTVLFATLEQAQPKRPLSDSLYAKVYDEGIEVTLHRGGDEVRKFYVGGNRKKNRTFFYDPNHGRYLMVIPGYTVYISGIFELDELAWREKRVFDFDWDTFNSLTVSFLDNQNKNFTIENKISGWTVSRLQKIDTFAVHNYLKALSSLEAEQFVRPEDSTFYGSLLKKPHRVRIDVVDIYHRTYSLWLYPLLDKKKYFVGRKKKNEIMLFSQKNILTIMREKEYFRRKDESLN